MSRPNLIVQAIGGDNGLEEFGLCAIKLLARYWAEIVPNVKRFFAIWFVNCIFMNV
jgi:hypothetical protein